MEYRQNILFGLCATGPNKTNGLMPLSVAENLAEMVRLYQKGIRYAHYHARNPDTTEQSASIKWYKDLGTGLSENYPNLIFSYGSSRQGPEVREMMDYAEVCVAMIKELYPLEVAFEGKVFFADALRHAYDLGKRGGFNEFFKDFNKAYPEIIEKLRGHDQPEYFAKRLAALLGESEGPAPDWISLNIILQSFQDPLLMEAMLASRGELARAIQFFLNPMEGAPHFVTWVAAPDILLTGDNQSVTSEGRERYGRLDREALANHVYASASLMRDNGVLHEVEVTSFPGGLNVLQYLRDTERSGVTLSSPTNVVVLFGFSDELRIPETYEEFQDAIRRVREAIDPEGKNDPEITITVGAVVREREAHKTRPLDLDGQTGPEVDDVTRICDYCLRSDSTVDMFRTGVEDSPYRLIDGQVIPVTNEQNVDLALAYMRSVGTAPETNPETVQRKLLGTTPVTQIGEIEGILSHLDAIDARTAELTRYHQEIASGERAYDFEEMMRLHLQARADIKR